MLSSGSACNWPLRPTQPPIHTGMENDFQPRSSVVLCSREGNRWSGVAQAMHHRRLLLHPFNGLFSGTTWISRYRRGKTSLDLSETRDNSALRCSGISWTICKPSAPRSRQITTPTPHHSILQAGCCSWRPTNSFKAHRLCGIFAGGLTG